MAKSEFTTYLRHKAASVLLDNFSCYEASEVFCVDYKNLCAYVRGSKDMPIKLALRILEYCNCSIVVFNNH